MKRLARAALHAYGLADARPTFISYHGNFIYRVDAPGGAGPGGVPGGRHRGLYVPNRYVLRIHMDYHSIEAIRSELQWLDALRRDADMPVPEPVPAPDGDLLMELPVPGGSGRRKCSLLRWLNGRFLTGGFHAGRARAWGRLMARLHEHALKWKLPGGFTRRQNDWDGMFGDGARFEFPAAELWEAIPPRFRGPFEHVTGRVRRVMEELGRGPDAYGLVHSDLDVKTNVLFAGGEARAIDFDDSGFAYWVHDLAFALSPWQGSPDEYRIQDALLDGYSEVRSFPRFQLRHLSLFKAAFNATLMLWMIDWAKLRPDSSEPEKHINRYGNNLMLYFDKRWPIA